MPRFEQPGQVIRWAIAQIDAQPTITARVRQQVDVFGQTLVGSGQLLQAAAGSHRVRLEMRFRAGPREGSIQQVSDGRRLWIYRQLAESSSLEVVDLQRLVRAAAGTDTSSVTKPAGQGGTAPAAQGGALPEATADRKPPAAARGAASDKTAKNSRAAPSAASHREAAPSHRLWESLAIDGLAGYLRSLDDAFNFESLEQTTLHGRPVWRLRGIWRPSAIASRWPEAAQALSEGREPHWNKLPEHLPHRVVAYIDRQNGLLHRVDFLREPDALLPWRHPQPTRLASIEWLGIRTGLALDAHHFSYDPGRQRPKDITQTYLERRGLLSAAQ